MVDMQKPIPQKSQCCPICNEVVSITSEAIDRTETESYCPKCAVWIKVTTMTRGEFQEILRSEAGLD